MYQEDKTKWSYLAAMVDGEGCIAIWRTKARAHDFATSGKTYGSFNLRIQIYNTSEVLMKWLVANFGGVYHSRIFESDKVKNSYNWRPKGEANTKKMLLGMLPYLVIKREQATLALEYIALPRNCPDKREPLYQRIRQLNQKGKSVTTNTLECSENGHKIESELTSDRESASVVTRKFIPTPLTVRTFAETAAHFQSITVPADCVYADEADID
jgi:hypothetical protein